VAGLAHEEITVVQRDPAWVVEPPDDLCHSRRSCCRDWNQGSCQDYGSNDHANEVLRGQLDYPPNLHPDRRRTAQEILSETILALRAAVSIAISGRCAISFPKVRAIMKDLNRVEGDWEAFHLEEVLN
jgi:hypothetical protein